MAREAREDLGEALSGVGPGRHGDEVDPRVIEKQADEFLAGIAGGTNDGDAGAGVLETQGAWEWRVRNGRLESVREQHGSGPQKNPAGGPAGLI